MANQDRCTDPTIGRFLLAYELDALTSAQTDLFERHLLACSHCRREVVGFSGAACVMRRAGLPLLRAASARQRAPRRVPRLGLLWRPVAVSAMLLALVAFLRLGPLAPRKQALPQQSITFALTVPADEASDPDPSRSGFGFSVPADEQRGAVFRYELVTAHGNG